MEIKTKKKYESFFSSGCPKRRKALACFLCKLLLHVIPQGVV
jgi:hypothetical protein